MTTCYCLSNSSNTSAPTDWELSLSRLTNSLISHLFLNTSIGLKLRNGLTLFFSLIYKLSNAAQPVWLVVFYRHEVVAPHLLSPLLSPLFDHELTPALLCESRCSLFGMHHLVFGISFRKISSASYLPDSRICTRFSLQFSFSPLLNER